MTAITQRHGSPGSTTKIVGTGSTTKLTYNLIGYDSHEQAVAAFKSELALSVTSGGQVLNLDTIDVKHREVDIWEGTATYIDPSKQEEEKPAVNQLQISFDTTGARTHITQSYETTGFPLANADANRHKHAINVKRTKHGAQVDGVDVIVPQLNFQITKYIAPPSDPFAFARNIARVTARINDSAWRGFEKGELLFLGARLSGRAKEMWTVDYQFSASENIEEADNFEIPGIGKITKLGHDFFWVEYAPSPAEDAILMNPVYAFTERIYKFGNFGSLGLGA